MWDLNALVPDHWHSFNFASFLGLSFITLKERLIICIGKYILSKIVVLMC